MIGRILGTATVSAAFVSLVAAALPSRQSFVDVGADDIGGAVTGPGGPEAGVWVIAETSDLQTKFVRIVVTDDSGRFLIPALPKATYNVWVRGYGLVDSPKSKSAPGSTLALRAVLRQPPEPPQPTIQLVTGCRCSRCLTRASSLALGQQETASRQM